MEPTPTSDKSTNEGSKSITAAENVASSTVENVTREMHNDTASVSTAEAPAIEATENEPSESINNNNNNNNDHAESVEVHIPGLNNALHLTLPHTTANTTVEELREMVIQELRVHVNTEENDKGNINNNTIRDNRNKRFFIRLMFRGKELQKDDHTLAEEQIKDGSAIHGMKTFVEPEYQRRQEEQRRRQGTRRHRNSRHQTVQEHSEHEEHEQQEQQQEEEEEGGGSHIGRNITSTLIPFSQQNLHETRQALATALSTFWPVTENIEREYTSVGASANTQESTLATSTHEGSSNSSTNNMGHNPTLTDIRRVPRSRLSNDELLRLIQHERMRAAHNTRNYTPSRVEDSHALHGPVPPLQPSSSASALAETTVTTNAVNNTRESLQEGVSAHSSALTRSAPNELESSNVNDNWLATSNDTGRLRVMQLTEGNRSSRRRGVEVYPLSVSDGNTANSLSENNIIRNVDNAPLHVPRRLNSASINIGNNIADNNVSNFDSIGATGAGTGGGGGGNGNQADDIEAHLEAERNYYWKEFSVNIVIGILFGPIGLIFPNKPIGTLAVVFGIVINMMCLMLNGYVNERPWEIEHHLQR